MKFQTNLNIHCRHFGAAYTDKVRPRTLRSGLISALGSGGRSWLTSLLYVLKKKKEEKKRKIEQCHKLLLVSGGGLALTRSYSERWQVARVGLCGLGAVCGAFKKKKKLD